MQLKKIKVYGKLRQFLGKSYFEAAVKSPQQAMSFLMANFEGLQKHMNDQLYKVKMGGTEITEDYFQTEFSQPAAFEQLMQLPSFRGASERFAKGGIAGLSGGDKSGPPPVRGPNPQGLLSLKNRVRNI